MIRVCGPLILAGFTVLGVGAQDAPTEAPSKSLKAQSDALQTEFFAARREWSLSLRDAEDESERAEILKNRTSIKPYIERAWKLHDENNDNPDAIEPLLFIVRMSFHDRPAVESNKKALDLILKNHYEDERLSQITAFLPRVWAVDKGRDKLRDMIADHPLRNVQANACYSLAFNLKNEYQANEQKVIATKRGDLGAQRDKVIALFKKATTEYDDVAMGSLRPFAEGMLFELENLSIGMTAPEIAGQDTDKVEFKLSDYRGKVVVIDFWGHW